MELNDVDEMRELFNEHMVALFVLPRRYTMLDNYRWLQRMLNEESGWKFVTDYQ